MPLDDVTREGERVMTICNSCRYCEGFCAVFPAMEQRLAFSKGDLRYLSNLCHNCGECLYACQYAPPHEFGINVPKTLASIRAHSYEQYAWPEFLRTSFRRQGVATSVVLTMAFAAAMIVSALLQHGGRLFVPAPGGNPYAVVPHDIMAWTFGLVFVYVLVALAVGCIRFWRDAGESLSELRHIGAWRTAVQEIAGLAYLRGSGTDCPDAHEGDDDGWRRRFHHLTAYGFLLSVASTSVAAIYTHLFGWSAPYGYMSLPVVLGTAGGIGLVVGPIGLYRLKQLRNPEAGDITQDGMDRSFILLLVLGSVTGLLLLGLRETAAMGILLLVHLAVVLTLFVSLPYGKFVHGIYRSAAIFKYALERARHTGPAGPDELSDPDLEITNLAENTKRGDRAAAVAQT